MSQETFEAHAKDSLLFAQFRAEALGVPAFVIENWMRVLVARTVC